MKIGILGAMIEEVQAIKNRMENVEIKKIGGREYFTGKLHEVEATLVFSRWGKVASSSTVTTLINQFGAEFIIFTGVAGAVSGKLNVGDIVIGDGLYQHDMDARPIFERHQIPLTEMILFRPEKKVVEQTKAVAKAFVTKIYQFIPEALLQKFSVSDPKIYTGIIASGDQFIMNAAEHDALRIDGEEVLAVEMEGAAIAQVCYEHGIPYVVVRTISDKADHSANVDFPAFVAEIAPHYSDGIIEGLCDSLKQEKLL